MPAGSQLYRCLPKMRFGYLSWRFNRTGFLRLPNLYLAVFFSVAWAGRGSQDTHYWRVGLSGAPSPGPSGRAYPIPLARTATRPSLYRFARSGLPLPTHRSLTACRPALPHFYRALAVARMIHHAYLGRHSLSASHGSTKPPGDACKPTNVRDMTRRLHKQYAAGTQRIISARAHTRARAPFLGTYPRAWWEDRTPVRWHSALLAGCLLYAHQSLCLGTATAAACQCALPASFAFLAFCLRFCSY